MMPYTKDDLKRFADIPLPKRIQVLERTIAELEEAIEKLEGGAEFWCPSCEEYQGEAVTVRECPHCYEYFNGDEEGKNCPQCNRPFTRRAADKGCPECLEEEDMEEVPGDTIDNLRELLIDTGKKAEAAKAEAGDRERSKAFGFGGGKRNDDR